MEVPVSQELQAALKTLIASAGTEFCFSRVQSHASLLHVLREWTLDALATSHLVQVSFLLHNELGLSLSDMELLGIPVDILPAFPGWRSASSEGFSPAPSGISLPALGAGQPMQILRMQLSPFSTTLSTSLLLLKRLLETLDPSVQILVAIEPGGDLIAMKDIISEFTPNARAQVSLLELQTTSVFAQDNARGARTKDGNAAVFVPRSFRRDRGREREDMTGQLDQNFGHLPLLRSRLFWEGGNIVNDCDRCFVGIDHIRDNMTALGLSEREVKLLFEADFGSPIFYLGRPESTAYQSDDFKTFATGQASFHIDLDMSLPGAIPTSKSPVALLADPQSTLRYAKEVLKSEALVEDHFLDKSAAAHLIEFEYSAYAEQRSQLLEDYKETLLESGYRVIRVPDLRVDPCDNLFSTRNLDFCYANVLCGKHNQSPSVFYLPFGIPVLDSLAEKAYREAGCTPVQVANSGRLANLLMLFSGGLRCACSQIA